MHYYKTDLLQPVNHVRLFACNMPQWMLAAVKSANGISSSIKVIPHENPTVGEAMTQGKDSNAHMFPLENFLDPCLSHNTNSLQFSFQGTTNPGHLEGVHPPPASKCRPMKGVGDPQKMLPSCRSATADPTIHRNPKYGPHTIKPIQTSQSQILESSLLVFRNGSPI